MKVLPSAMLLASLSFGCGGGSANVELAKENAQMAARLADWPQLDWYKEANAALGPAAPGEERVVFFGASMTEGWGPNFREYFPGKPYVNRGIRGQSTGQMLVRFRQDVIELHPKVVLILGGTNDIGSQVPIRPETTEGNWESMAELAKANGIRVIFASITPSTDIPWHRGLQPADKIRALNAWLKEYCANHGLIYLDYYSALTNAEGGMRSDLTMDGVHANAKGYAIMAPLAQAAINKALAN